MPRGLYTDSTVAATAPSQPTDAATCTVSIALRSDGAAVLRTYALIGHRHHGTDLATGLHRGPHVAEAERHLHAR